MWNNAPNAFKTGIPWDWLAQNKKLGSVCKFF